MEKQQAVLDKIPSYDRKMNFFDNITTTANIPPPRTMMNFDHRHHGTFYKRPNNNNNNNNHNQHYQPQQHLRKPYSCASEQHGNSYSSSVGYFSGNDTKSSCGEESLLEKAFESSKKVEPKKDEEEKEPEWFSVPATLEDFIDLHGFSDEDIQEQPKDDANVEQAVENQRNNLSNNSSFHQEYQPPQNRRYNQNNSYNSRYSNNNSAYSSHNSSYNQSFSSHNSSYSQQSNNSYYNGRNMNYRNNQVNYNNQRFRNPLHFNKPVRASSSKIINPFFDAWKSGKGLNQQTLSFNDLMETNDYQKSLPNGAMHISEVENRMKQQQNLNLMNYQAPPPTAVPQFFQNLATNWGVRVNEHSINAYQYQNNVGPPQVPQSMPTQEQLQQFTSEIMRNAILRKNQQYHDENNYQK